MNLYNLSQNYDAFMALVDEGEIPEDALWDTMEAINDEWEAKAESVALAVKNLLAEAAAMEAEATALADRAERRRRDAERLEAYLLTAMTKTATRKIDRPRARITVRSSKAVEVSQGFMEWAKANAPALVSVRTVTEEKPDKTAIKSALDAGKEVPFAAVVERRKVKVE